MTAKVSVIGLGSMGLGMAQSLLRKGLAVTGADLNPDAVKKLEAAGGGGFASAAEARTRCGHPRDHRAWSTPPRRRRALRRGRRCSARR